MRSLRLLVLLTLLSLVNSTILRRLFKRSRYQDESTECTVCNEAYDTEQHQERLLPCKHKLCSTCLEHLEEFSTVSNHLRRLNCPFCRHVIPSRLQKFEDKMKLVNSIVGYAIVLSRILVSFPAACLTAGDLACMLVGEVFKLNALMGAEATRGRVIHRLLIHCLALGPLAFFSSIVLYEALRSPPSSYNLVALNTIPIIDSRAHRNINHALSPPEITEIWKKWRLRVSISLPLAC